MKTFNSFTTEELQEEVNKRNKRLLTYEKYKELLINTFNNTSSINTVYFQCLPEFDPVHKVIKDKHWEINLNNRCACKVEYTQYNTWHVYANKTGISWENFSEDKLIDIVYRAIGIWIQEEIKRVEKLKFVTFPLSNSPKKDEIINPVEQKSEANIYDERQQKFMEKQQKENLAKKIEDKTNQILKLLNDEFQINKEIDKINDEKIELMIEINKFN